MCIYRYRYSYLYISVYIYMCVCVFVCVYACVCVPHAIHSNSRGSLLGCGRRWLQDTSKRKLADFWIFFAPPPFLFPRVHPRLTR